MRFAGHYILHSILTFFGIEMLVFNETISEILVSNTIIISDVFPAFVPAK